MVKNRNKVYAYCILDDNKFIVESNIVYTWDECQNIVKGKKSRYKSFKTQTEAKKWLECGAEYESKSEKQDKLIDLFAELDRDAIYFDAGTGRGKGVEVRLTNFDGIPILYKIIGNSKINEYGNYYLSEGSTNNFGELVGLFSAIKYALKYNIHTICGDSSLVIDYWSKGRYNKENLGKDT